MLQIKQIRKRKQWFKLFQQEQNCTERIFTHYRFSWMFFYIFFLILRLCWIYFWLCSSPVCSCSLQHCFVYTADEPQHLNCDASVKDWVEHVKINNTPSIFLLSNKPAFLWGLSLKGPEWEPHESPSNVASSPVYFSLIKPTHTRWHVPHYCLVLHSLFGTTSSRLSFSPPFCSSKWPFSGNVISTGKEGQLITHSVLIR